MLFWLKMITWSDIKKKNKVVEIEQNMCKWFLFNTEWAIFQL